MGEGREEEQESHIERIRTKSNILIHKDRYIVIIDIHFHMLELDVETEAEAEARRAEPKDGAPSEQYSV